jgi:putative DNA primase/helicase
MIDRDDERLFAGVTAQRSLDLVRLAEVEPEELRWLWRGRIARGKVTMIVGDPGDGKSYLTLAIAAAISLGKALPDGEATRASDCILWNGEDGLADTIRVRAERVGADLSRLHVIQAVTGSDGARVPFGLQHLPDLYAELERRGDVDLVVIDPLAALLAGIDAHKDAEVRSLLQPLSDLAIGTGVAVVVVAHLNKATAQRALYRVGGSIGFVGLARSVLLVARDHESGRRAVAQIKSNLAEQVPPIEFTIDDRGLWWGGIAEDLDSDRLLAAPMDGEQRSAIDEAKRAIVDALEDAGGELSARDLGKTIESGGVSRMTYQRARAALARDKKIERQRSRFQGEVRWKLCSLRQASSSLQKVTNNGEVDEQWAHTSSAQPILSQKIHTTSSVDVSRARAREVADNDSALLTYAEQRLGGERCQHNAARLHRLLPPGHGRGCQSDCARRLESKHRDSLWPRRLQRPAPSRQLFEKSSQK